MPLNVGGEDELDRDGLRRLIASINRYVGERTADGVLLTSVKRSATPSRGT